jgi:SAM-dependent methyltransferase
MKAPVVMRLAPPAPMALVKTIARPLVPARARRWIRERLHGANGAGGLEWEHLCSLRRVRPIRRDFGWQSGQPIDRHYIEDFLARHADDVRGRVLEIADNAYTRRFGGDRVTQSDVLHVAAGAPGATIVADLADGRGIPSDAFDCVILTQTLQYIYETRSAVRTLYRILRPGGVGLVTVPGISQIARYDMDNWGEYWRFTSPTAHRLFTEVFPAESVSVAGHGNVLAAIAFLHGLVCSELRPAELDFRDDDYEVIVTVRAVKPAGEGTSSKR